MKKKQAVAFLLSTTMAVGGAVQAFGAASDIGGHWAQATIAKWQDAGRIGGYEDGTFKPDRTITRAEFVRLLNSATSTSFTSNASVNFSDVKESDWFYADVAKAVGAKITSGFEDGTFRPGETVTRMQAAVFICNAKGLAANEAGANLLTDASEIPAWAKGAVGAVISAGYMSGYPDGSFGGSKGMTRAEAVSTLDRVLGGGVTTPAPDNQGVSTPSTDNEDTTTIAEAKQEGNMVWRSGGGGGGSRGSSSSNGGSSSSDNDSDIVTKDTTINNQSDANKLKGKTVFGDVTINLNSNLDLENVRFKGNVKVNSGTVAAAYIGDDTAVAAANTTKWTILLIGTTSFDGNVTVVSDKADAPLVEIKTLSRKAISNFIARTAARIVGFTTAKVQANAPVEVADGKIENVTAETGAKITVEKDATIEVVDVVGDAEVTVQDGAKVDKVAVTGNANADVALEGTAKVDTVTVSDTATAKVDVAADAEVGTITVTSTNSKPATIVGDGTIAKIEAVNPDAVNTDGAANAPKVEEIGGGTTTPEDVLVTGIEITADSKEVEIGGELQLTANVTPSNATNKGVTWSITLDASLKDGDVKISTDGLLTVADSAVENAKITVTATAVDGSNAKGEYEVTVVKQAGKPAITGDKTEVTLNGQEQTVVFTPAGFATGATINWSVEPEVSGVSISNGMLTISAATTVTENTTVTVKATNTAVTPNEVATTTLIIKPAAESDEDKAKKAVAELTIVATAATTKTEAEGLIKTEAEKALTAAGLTGWTATPSITTTLTGDAIGTTKTLEVSYQLKETETADPITATGTVTVAASAAEKAAIDALTGLEVELAANDTVDADTVKGAIEAAAADLMTGDLAGYNVTAELVDFDAATALTAPVKVKYVLTNGTDNFDVVDLTVTVTKAKTALTAATVALTANDTAGGLTATVTPSANAATEGNAIEKYVVSIWAKGTTDFTGTALATADIATSEDPLTAAIPVSDDIVAGTEYIATVKVIAKTDNATYTNSDVSEASSAATAAAAPSDGGQSN